MATINPKIAKNIKKSMLLFCESSKIIFHQFLFDKKRIKSANARNSDGRANENYENVKRVSVSTNFDSKPNGKASDNYASPAKEGRNESVNECSNIFNCR